MRLYDGCISPLCEILAGYPHETYTPGGCADWPDEGKNQIIFQSDMAYELGGNNLAAVNGIAFTDSEDAVPGDEVSVYGPDLRELKADSAYARITLVRVKSTKDMDSNELYQMIRRIDYSRYHISPKGYMMRISAVHQREAVRVGKEALEEGLSFEKVGKLFIDAYHKHPEVEAVKIIFVTLPDFPYEEAGGLLQKCEAITKTLDHLAKKVQMDCHACALKDVCEEVEALYKDNVK